MATWTDIDPRTDFFSVEIRGLTNAQQTTNVDGKLEIKQKTLVLNFSRPGDTINELADIIRYGVPALTDPACRSEFSPSTACENALIIIGFTVNILGPAEGQTAAVIH